MMELPDIVALYLENLDLKLVSINSYRSVLGTYLRYLKKNAILHPKRTDVIHYREHLRNQGSKAATIQKQMIVLKSFYKWARINCRNYGISEHYAFDIAEGIRGAKIEATYKKEPLSIQQAKGLIETAHQYVDTIQGARNYAMVILMLVTGLRAIEVSRALRSDLSSMDGTDILYIQGKGRDDKDLFVKLPSEIMTALHHYFQMRTDQDNHLFVSHSHSVRDQGITTKTIQESIRELMMQADVWGPKISVHSLRHTCAYLNIKAGGSLEATQQLLRHRNIDTTLIYAHNINRVKDESEYRIANTLFSTKGLEEHHEE
jgi:site-specific recombinase XerD